MNSHRSFSRIAPLVGAILSLCLLSLVCGCATPKPTSGTEESFGMPHTDEAFSASKLAPTIEHRDPPSWEKITQTEPGPRARSMQSNIIEFAFSIYTNHITKIDGARCEHRPTCSRYAVDAVRKHGFVVGSWLTIDRLMRGSQSSSLRTLPIYKFENGRPYFRDPVEENDFFF
jgi:putative membrane protein insertion efficiency factor